MKRRVTFTDSFKVYNVMLHLFIYFFILFLYNLSSLLNKLKFHSISSDDYEKKIYPFDSTPICLFVAYSVYTAFPFRPSIFKHS